MRKYIITIERYGNACESYEAKSEWPLRAVLIWAFAEFFGKPPRYWWADKKNGMGSAYSRRERDFDKSARSILIHLHQDRRFAAMKRRHAAHLRLNGPYLLTERRAA